jgi:hypothetical protein
MSPSLKFGWHQYGYSWSCARTMPNDQELSHRQPATHANQKSEANNGKRQRRLAPVMC